MLILAHHTHGGTHYKSVVLSVVRTVLYAVERMLNDYLCAIDHMLNKSMFYFVETTSDEFRPY